jgi:large subunit ribosomal protein L7/L12
MQTRAAPALARAARRTTAMSASAPRLFVQRPAVMSASAVVLRRTALPASRRFSADTAEKDAALPPVDNSFVGDAGQVSGTEPPEKLTIVNSIDELPSSPEVEELVDRVSKLNMMEMMSFLQKFSGKLGVPWEKVLESGMSGGGGGGAPAAAAPAAAPAEEKEEEKEDANKTEFAVRLNELEDGKKYAVLKEVRNLKPGMTIAESKKFVEELPSVLVSSIDKDEGLKWVKALEAVGGKAELV